MMRGPLAHILTLSIVVTSLLILVISCGRPAGPTLTPQPVSPTATRTGIPSPTPPYSPTPLQTTYVVQSGDTLWDIANRFETTWLSLMELNGLTSTLIYSGTHLHIPKGDSSGFSPIITPTPSHTATLGPTAPALSSLSTPPVSTPTLEPSPGTLEEWRGVYVGMAADDVVSLWGDPVRTRVVGHEPEGVVVEWVYSDAKLIMKMWEIAGVTCYRVAEISLH